MRIAPIAAGVLILLPGLALAQPADPNCVASNANSRAEGTILGGIGGAILGGAIGHGAGGAVLGGVGGALAGNAIAGARNTPCPGGYVYAPPPGYAGYAPPPPPPPEARRFWASAPADIHDRIHWLWRRVDRASRRGLIGPGEADRARRELRNIRRSADDLSARDGGLSPSDRNYIQARLDYVSQQLNWMVTRD